MGKDIRVKTDESVYHRYAAELKEALLRDDVRTLIVYEDNKDKTPIEYKRITHGRWEEREVIDKDEATKAIDEWQVARCSACGKYHTTPYMYYFDDFKFCPNCGTYMLNEENK